jgi:hypothetical protein
MVQPFKFVFELNYEKLAYWTPKGSECLPLGRYDNFWLDALCSEACPLCQRNTFIMSMHLELGFDLNLIFMIIKNWYIRSQKAPCACLYIKMHCLPTAVYDLLANLIPKFIICTEKLEHSTLLAMR